MNINYTEINMHIHIEIVIEKVTCCCSCRRYGELKMTELAVHGGHMSTEKWPRRRFAVAVRKS